MNRQRQLIDAHQFFLHQLLHDPQASVLPAAASVQIRQPRDRPEHQRGVEGEVAFAAIDLQALGGAQGLGDGGGLGLEHKEHPLRVLHHHRPVRVVGAQRGWDLEAAR